ncbi:MAG: PEGA domain-containing protein [Coriobacteriia bacterium]|nr:PEGA domain-containing protein [Coriobacteriia bacterium]
MDDRTDDEGHDLWKEAWARPGRTEEARSQRRSASGRRIAEIGGRDAHLTFEPPPGYEPVSHEPRREGRGRGSGSGRGPARPSERGARPQSATARQHPSNARALAPRRSVIDYHGRRSAAARTAMLGVLGVLLVAGIGAFTWWFLTRPASAAVTVTPKDARVVFAGRSARTGGLTLDKLEPGTYAVNVSRTGFETATVSLDLERGRETKADIALVPIPMKLSFTTRPKGATVAVRNAAGEVVTGRTPCALTVPAGQLSVSVAKAGCNTFTRTSFVDAPASFDLILDPKGQLVQSLGSLNAGGAPKGVAVSPGGVEAWTSILNGTTSIEIFDLKTMKRTGGVDLGKYGSVEVIFSSDGSKAYASQMETAKVFEVDVKSRKVTRSFKTESAWTKVIALSPDGKTLYAANWSGNDVSVIDLVSGALTTRIGTAKTPRGLWPTADGKYLYVAGFDTGDLQRIDLATRAIRTIFKSGGAMRHLVADEKRGILYASDMGKDKVWALDMTTLKVTKFCDTDAKPNTIDLSPDGRVLFISNRGENNPKSYYIPGYEWGTILLFDTVTKKPLDAIVGGNQCTALDVSDDGKKLVFSDFLDNRLRVYAVPSDETLIKGAPGRFAQHFADLKKRR